MPLNSYDRQAFSLHKMHYSDKVCGEFAMVFCKNKLKTPDNVEVLGRTAITLACHGLRIKLILKGERGESAPCDPPPPTSTTAPLFLPFMVDIK